MSLDRFDDVLDNPSPTITLVPENGKLTVPDDALLFGAEFQRDGHDLLLVNDGAPTIRIEDYFVTDPPAPILAPNGGQLDGSVVARLAGPIAPGQYAQAGDTARGGDPIGQVETMEGVVTVQRADGTVQTLEIGTKIFANDVVETQAGGSVSLTFADGTIFTLAAASRMVIDDLIYDPGSTDNSATFNLVQGSFVFIAGQVAKTGGMDVNTPSATMGIRGTTVLARIETRDGAVTTQVTLVRDADGALGSIELRALDGTLIEVINVTDTRWEVTTEDGQTFSVERAPVDDSNDLALVADAFLALQSAANRIIAGETFVTLPAPPSAIDDPGPDDPNQSQGGNDVDIIDEPIIENPDPGPGQGGSDGGGGLTPPDDTPPELPPLEVGDVVVQGAEDAGETGGIEGQIETGPADGLTFEITSGPANGTATVTNAGTFNYAPDPNFNGVDSFTYRVIDAEGDEATGTVFVQVAPVNDAPELPDTTTSAPEDGLLVASLVATDVDGDPLSYSLVSGPASGTVTLRPDGAYSYIPNADFEGQDSFQVAVQDINGATDTATVFVSVTPINDTPLVTTPVGQATGTLAEDGAQTSASGTLTAFDPDLGDTLTWTGTQTGSFGALQVQPGGQWTYTLSAAAADQLSEGQQVVETLTVTVQDSALASSTETIEIRITGTNDRPEITSTQVDLLTVEAVDASDGYLAFGTFASVDIDQNDTQSFAFGEVTFVLRDDQGTVIPLTAATGFTQENADALAALLTVTSDGSWQFDVPGSVFGDQLPEGFTLTLSTTVTVTDNSGSADAVSAEQPFALTLLGTNDAPLVISADVSGSLSEPSNAPAAFSTFAMFAAFADAAADPGGLSTSGQITVFDPDIGDTVTVRAIPQGEGYLGTLTVPDGALGTIVAGLGTQANIAWLFAVDAADLDGLGGGQTVEQVYRIEITDAAGGVVTQDVTITLTGENDAPVVDFETSVATGGVTEDVTMLATGTLVATDVDGPTDPLDWRLPEAGGVTPTALTGSFGTLTITAAGVWTYTLTGDVQSLAVGATEEEVFTVEVFDGIAATPQQVTVTITGTNDDPVIDAAASTLSATVIEGTTQTQFTGQVAATDVDAGDGATWSLVATGEGDPALGLYGTFAITGDGAWTYTLTDSLEVLNAPVGADTSSATETFTVEVSDGNGGMAQQQITINLVGENDAPVVTVSASDLTGDVVEDAEDLTATGTLVATDVDGPTDPLDWRLPEAGGVTPTALTGSFGTLTITAAGVWTYTLTGDVQSLAVGATEEEVFTVEVFDGIAATPQQVTVTITGTNDDPVIDATASTLSATVTEGTTATQFTGQVAATDVDAGDGATWSVVPEETEGESEPSSVLEGQFGTFAITGDGAWTYTLTDSLEVLNAPVGADTSSATETFTVEVSDGNGGTAQQQITINLVGENDPAVVDITASTVQGDIVEDAVPNTVTGTLVARDVDGPDTSITWGFPAALETVGNPPQLVGAFGTLALTAAGVWTYTLDAALSNALSEGAEETDTFTVMATDSSGATTQQTITIDITGANDAPILTSAAAQQQGTVTEDAEDNTTSGQLTATDPESDTVLWGVQGSIEGTFGTFAINGAGEWTYTLDNIEANVLNDGPGEGATETFTVMFSDTAGDPDPQTVDITVTVIGNNDAPVIAGELVFENTDDAGVPDGTLQATDPEGEAITFAGLDAGTPVTAGQSFATANGTVTVNADGTFTYAPNEGFVGFDSFDFRATDASGGTTQSTARIAVESGDGSGGEDNAVDVSISPAPTVNSPAGSLFIDVNEVTAPKLNVVFALDRSGSVSNADWRATIDAVDAALDDLLVTFGSSETDVQVSFVVFSSSAAVTGPFDLSAPAGGEGAVDGWAEQLAALRTQTTGGGTDWRDALEATNTLLSTDGLGAGASNFLFFVTDGVPSNSAAVWQAARDSLETTHNVEIDAFGIGDVFTNSNNSNFQLALDSLNGLDGDRPDPGDPAPAPPPYFTALNGPNDLTAALTANPVFNPALVSLSVTLDIEGDALGPVMSWDETSRALQADGLDYVVAFAELEGIADLLGVSNRFSISAEYDLNGDGTSDLTLFSTEVLGRSDTALDLPDTGDFPAALLDGSDLLFGSDQIDRIEAGDGNDLVVGFGGNDVIQTGAGIDTVLAGAGDDRIQVQDAGATRPAAEGGDGDLIDGGTGQDTVVFAFTNDLFSNVLDNLTLRNVETLDMTNDGSNTMRLTLSDVINLSSDPNTLLDSLPVDSFLVLSDESAVIRGDTADFLFLEDGPDGAWDRVDEDVDIGGGEFVDIWRYDATSSGGGILATLAIDTDIEVNPVIA